MNRSAESLLWWFHNWKEVKKNSKTREELISQSTKSHFVKIEREALTEFPAELFHNSAVHREIEVLFLSQNNIARIPVEISLLRGLICLDLCRNKINGKIASELTALSNLAGLDLSHNKIEHLPDDLCTKMTQLQFLNLSCNRLHVQEKRTGEPVLKDVKHLQMLEHLEIGGNKLTRLPDCIGQCGQLRVLSVKDNNLTELPGSIVRLVGLRKLEAQRNNLRRLIDDAAAREMLRNYEYDVERESENVKIALDGANSKHRMLRRYRHSILYHVLRLGSPSSSQNVDGGDEKDVKTLRTDSYAWIPGISMSASNWGAKASFSIFPDDFDTLLTDHQKAQLFYQQLGRLTHLNLSNNYLTQAQVLVSIGFLHHLVSLDLSSNHISEPRIIATNSTPLPFDESKTILVDDIVAGGHSSVSETSTPQRLLTSLIDDPSTTTSLRTPGHGPTSSQVMGMQSGLSLVTIESIDLSNNSIGGSFPSWIGKLGSWCKLLTEINLSNNKIDSMQTTAIQYLSSLKVLKLRRNKITYLPSHMFRLSSLELLDLRKNCISSIHPRIFSNMKNLRELDLERNQIGRLPKSIGKCKSLRILKLKHNRLGTLPDEISDCENLFMLDASYNQLTRLPRTVDKFKSLRRLWLQHNRLESLPRELRFIRTLIYFNCDHNEVLFQMIQENRWKDLEEGHSDDENDGDDKSGEDEIEDAKEKSEEEDQEDQEEQEMESIEGEEMKEMKLQDNDTEQNDKANEEDLDLAEEGEEEEEESVDKVTIQDIINMPNSNNCTIM